MASPINLTHNLADIYPDVRDELCNRHIKQLSKLKSLFAQIYDEMQPEAFVIVNGVAKVVDLGPDLQLNFALENGITVLFSKTYKNEDMFINGNHIQEEILFNSKGRHEDGIHQKIDEIKTMVKLIRKSANPDKEFYGGIIYIYSNIGEHLLGYQQCLMVGLAITLLLVHEELANYDRKTLKELLLKSDQKLQEKIITNMLEKYELNKLTAELYMGQANPSNQTSSDFNINVFNPNSDHSIGTNKSIKLLQSAKDSRQKRGSKNSTKTRQSRRSIESLQFYNQLYKEQLQQLNINLKQNHKLILCKMDISKDEENYYLHKMDKLKEIDQILKENNYSKNQLINEKGKVKIPPSLQPALQEQQYHLIQYCQQVRCLMNSLINNNLDINDFINEKYQLDIDFHIHDQTVIDMLNQIKLEIPYIQSFCILQGNVLLFSIHKQYYAEIVVHLRKMLNQYKFSTFRFLETVQKMNEEEKCDISQVMFTTMPSLGCAIYQPTEDAWI